MAKPNTPQPSRRTFLAAAAGTAALAQQAHGQTETKAQPVGMPLTLAGYPYERVLALESGDATIDRCHVTFERSSIRELNDHVFDGAQTRHVTEVGLIPYLLAFCNGEFRDYELLPVFALKLFRHKSIYVRKDRGIRTPKDLRGRKVATPGYSSSGLTWVRGIIGDEYGVTPDQIEWIVTSKDSAAKQTGGSSRWENVLPDGDKVSITKAPAGVDESTLLLNGTVDAVVHPAEPQAYINRHPLVDRLFADHRSVEQGYFRKTGIFPVMHIVAIRKDVAAQNPWLRKAVFDGYCAAKQRDYAEMKRIRWAFSSLPWYGQEVNETIAAMGDNFYSYGLPDNRLAIETACRYLHEQGLATRQLTIEELFHQSTWNLKDAQA